LGISYLLYGPALCNWASPLSFSMDLLSLYPSLIFPSSPLTGSSFPNHFDPTPFFYTLLLQKKKNSAKSCFFNILPKPKAYITHVYKSGV